LDQRSDAFIGNVSLKKLWSLKEVLKSAEEGKSDRFDIAIKAYYDQYRYGQNYSIINILYHSRFIEAIQKYPTLLESTELGMDDKNLLKYIIFCKKYIDNPYQQDISADRTIEKFEQAILLLQSPGYAIPQEIPPTLVDIFSKLLFSLSREHFAEVTKIAEKYPKFFDH
jgi:hypothetical protein